MARWYLLLHGIEVDKIPAEGRMVTISTILKCFPADRERVAGEVGWFKAENLQVAEGSFSRECGSYG